MAPLGVHSGPLTIREAQMTSDYAMLQEAFTEARLHGEEANRRGGFFSLHHRTHSICFNFFAFEVLEPRKVSTGQVIYPVLLVTNRDDVRRSCAVSKRTWHEYVELVHKMRVGVRRRYRHTFQEEIKATPSLRKVPFFVPDRVQRRKRAIQEFLENSTRDSRQISTRLFQAFFYTEHSMWEISECLNGNIDIKISSETQPYERDFLPEGLKFSPRDMLLQPYVTKTAFDEVGFDLVSEDKLTLSDSEEDQTDAQQQEVAIPEQTNQSVKNNNDEEEKPEQDSSPPIQLNIDAKVHRSEEEHKGNDGKESQKPPESSKSSKRHRGASVCDLRRETEESETAKPKEARKRELTQCCSRFYEIDWEQVLHPKDKSSHVIINEVTPEKAHNYWVRRSFVNLGNEEKVRVRKRKNRAPFLEIYDPHPIHLGQCPDSTKCPVFQHLQASKEERLARRLSVMRRVQSDVNVTYSDGHTGGHAGARPKKRSPPIACSAPADEGTLAAVFGGGRSSGLTSNNSSVRTKYSTSSSGGGRRATLGPSRLQPNQPSVVAYQDQPLQRVFGSRLRHDSLVLMDSRDLVIEEEEEEIVNQMREEGDD